MGDQTMADLPKPTAGVNTELMIRAWDLNVATQRDMIAQMEHTRRDNRRTRFVVYAATAALVLSVVWIHVRSDEVGDGMREVVATVNGAGQRLESVERKLNAVADAVVATNEAEVVEAEAQAAELGAIKATIEAPRGARRATPVPAPEVAAVKRKALAKRRAAQVKAMRAQVELAPDPEHRAEVKAELDKLRREAKAEGLSLD